MSVEVLCKSDESWDCERIMVKVTRVTETYINGYHRREERSGGVDDIDNNNKVANY